jgi:hypothetical protein
MVAASCLVSLSAQALADPPGAYVIHRNVKVGDHTIFYREAGTPGKPVILLLHGYPTSSYMYRDLMRELASEYHLIAPDMPGDWLCGLRELRRMRCPSWRLAHHNTTSN